MILQAGLAFAVSCAVFFGLMAVFSWLARVRATPVQLAEALLAEHRKEEATPGWLDRSARWAAMRGFPVAPETMVVLFAAACVLTYVATGLVFPGHHPLLHIVPSVLVTVLSGWLALEWYGAKRRRLFASQLLTLTEVMCSAVESGVGPQAALDMAASVSDPPLGPELAAALRRATVSQDLIGELRELETRFPSRALRLLISTMEIDRDIGGRTAPMLRKISSLLRQDAELEMEAQAELAQTKMEFLAVFALVAGILVYLSYALLLSGSFPVNLITITAMVLVFANLAVGAFRGLRLFQRLRGKEE